MKSKHQWIASLAAWAMGAALWLPVAVPAAALADGDTVGVHVSSVHSQPGYDDVNPGLYYRWANGVQVGAFRNSLRKGSVYAGYGLARRRVPQRR